MDGEKQRGERRTRREVGERWGERRKEENKGDVEGKDD